MNEETFGVSRQQDTFRKDYASLTQKINFVLTKDSVKI